MPAPPTSWPGMGLVNRRSSASASTSSAVRSGRALFSDAEIRATRGMDDPASAVVKGA